MQNNLTSVFISGIYFVLEKHIDIKYNDYMHQINSFSCLQRFALFLLYVLISFHSSLKFDWKNIQVEFPEHVYGC